MSDPELELSLEQVQEELQQQSADTKPQDAARRQHHKERLAKLFRHIGKSPEGRRLLDILTRYREAEPS
jgi:hypothetical protein